MGHAGVHCCRDRRGMILIVVDTNVLAYLLLSEERSAAAQAVLERDSNWIAPPIWRCEFRNVLVQHVRRKIFAETRAREAWPLADGLVRTIAEPDPELVLTTAFARNLSAYDAEFVALADASGVRLVTDDTEVLERCPDIAISIRAFAGGA